MGSRQDALRSRAQALTPTCAVGSGHTGSQNLLLASYQQPPHSLGPRAPGMKHTSWDHPLSWESRGTPPPLHTRGEPHLHQALCRAEPCGPLPVQTATHKPFTLRVACHEVPNCVKLSLKLKTRSMHSRGTARLGSSAGWPQSVPGTVGLAAGARAAPAHARPPR